MGRRLSCKKMAEGFYRENPPGIMRLAQTYLKKKGYKFNSWERVLNAKNFLKLLDTTVEIAQRLSQNDSPQRRIYEDLKESEEQLKKLKRKERRNRIIKSGKRSS